MSTVITGAQGSFKLNGQKVAYIGGVRVSQENTQTDIEVLDQPEVAEFAFTGHKAHCSATLFKVDQNAAVALGLDFTSLDSFFTAPTAVIELYDRINDKVQYTLQGVVWEGGDMSLSARGVWEGTLNFKAKLGGAPAGDGSL